MTERLLRAEGPVQTERLLRRRDRVESTLAAYVASGGMKGLARAREVGTQGVTRLLSEAGLVGRGGAGFPTGRKWEGVRTAKDPVRYVVLNADESEPGTFKDRVLIESDPFLVLEGLLIAAFTVNATRAYIFIRGEYRRQAAILAQAAGELRQAGYLDGLGAVSGGFGWSGGATAPLTIEIRRGAGAYVTGEETAMFNAIEGYRSQPRSKPPFPNEAGLFGKPTLINNVETIANVPDIVAEGEAWYRSLGTAASPGTKIFTVSGHVGRPGAYELPFGTPLSELLRLAGAPAGGDGLGAVLLGGAAGAFVFPADFDLPLSYEAARERGITLGSGAVMAFDTETDLWDVAERLADFFAHESCGQCVPCRIGTKRQQEIVAKLAAGRGSMGGGPAGRGGGPGGDHGRGGGPGRSDAEARALLLELGQVMGDASICGLGQAAGIAIRSLIEHEAASPAAATREG
ncbi:MAG: complex I 51 kDa subunit family protein [Symbiobacteriia bacterium]